MSGIDIVSPVAALETAFIRALGGTEAAGVGFFFGSALKRTQPDQYLVCRLVTNFKPP